MKPTLCYCPVLVLLLLLNVSVASQVIAQPSESDKISRIGRWSARWHNGGLWLNWDGVPFVKGGLVQYFATSHSWGAGGKPPVALARELPEGGREYTALFQNRQGDETFRAEQTAVVRPDGTATFTIRARWEGRGPARLEWNPVRLWFYSVIGGRFVATTRERQQIEARLGSMPYRGENGEGRFAPAWSRLAFPDSPLGEIAFDVPEGQPGADASDARLSPWIKDQHVFWFGYEQAPLEPGHDLILTMTLKVTPHRPAPSASPEAPQPVPLAAHTVSVVDASHSLPPLRDAQNRPLLIPQPKKATFPSGRLLVGPHFVISADLSRAGKDTDRLWSQVRQFAAALRSVTSQPVRAIRGRGELSGRSVGIRVSVNPEEAKTSPEGYRLIVRNTGAQIIGQDAAGAFYGLQTLRQLLQKDEKGRTCFVSATITDWPTLKFRGAHLFTGRNALPFHRKLIERVLSRLKMNFYVLECEYAQWKSHPEIHVSHSMPLTDLKRSVEFARAHFMEPVPLVNTLGHSEWMFGMDKHKPGGRRVNLHLAEDEQQPYAYDASNPDTYKFVFDIYAEAMEIFRPRWFHIGHDEVKILGSDEFGRYPARPQNVTKGITRLFLDDTNRLANWLRQRGARPMLWADMLLAPEEGPLGPLTAANAATRGEAEARRAQIPKDAVVADWRYTPPSEGNNGLAIFKAIGVDTLGCAWYEPENVRGWAQQAAAKGAWGTLQTTWAGYDSGEHLLETPELRQFTAFVLAAEYAWSGTSLHPRASGRSAEETLPWSAEEVFARLYREEAKGGTRPGWTLSLGQAANIDLGNAWPDAAFRVQAGATRNDVEFRNPSVPLDVRVTTAGQSWGGVMLVGRLNPQAANAFPTAVSLPIGRKAETLAFVHATGYGAAEGARVATYRVVYHDGSALDIPLTYGRQIRALDDAASTAFTTTGFRPLSGEGEGRTMRLFRWRNPHPDREIARLEFRADDIAASPILFAVTGY